MKTKIYIEGGGGSHILDEKFREGWTKFFENGEVSTKPRVVRGKGRARTWDLYKTAVENRQEGELYLLLVDSEENSPGRVFSLATRFGPSRRSLEKATECGRRRCFPDDLLHGNMAHCRPEDIEDVFRSLFSRNSYSQMARP